MGRIRSGLESILNAGKSLGRGLKNKAVIAGMAVALPFMVANYARGSEGGILINYCVDNIGRSRYSLAHVSGSLEGKDNHDIRFVPMFLPGWQTDTKAISYISGSEWEWQADARPLDSETSATVYCSMISKSGAPIVVENAREYLDSISVTGCEGYNVFVNGQNAREISGIDFGTLTGSYGSGETIRAVEISFQKIEQQKHAPEVETLSLPSGNIHNSSATLEGKVIDDGSEGCEWQFSYWPAGNPGDISSTSFECCKTSGETFSATVNGLSPGSAYVFVAKAKNSIGLDEGSAISFTTLSGTEPNNPPNGRDKNPIKGTWGKDTLFLQYLVDGFTNTNNTEHKVGNETGAWALEKAKGASVEFDSMDVLYAFPFGVSKTTTVTSKANAGSRFPRVLSVDRVPQDFEGDILIELGYQTSPKTSLGFANAANRVKFSFPVNTSGNFSIGDSNEPLTFSLYEPLDPNSDSNNPLYDIRAHIKKGQAVSLKALNGALIPGTIAYAIVSNSRIIGDTNRDGKLGADDYALVWNLQGFKGGSIADIANSAGEIGFPDGVINIADAYALWQKLSTEERAKIPNPSSISQRTISFDSGNLEKELEGLVHYAAGWPQWHISSNNPYSGDFCLESGNVGDTQQTSLAIKANCSEGIGSYWLKTSCESPDKFRFYNNGSKVHEVSGVNEWQEKSFPVSDGENDFTFIYRNEFSSNGTKGAAYIDELSLPLEN